MQNASVVLEFAPPPRSAPPKPGTKMDDIQQDIAEALREVKGHAKLTGGPGVGKSTLIKTLNYPVIAPTNKAAAVVNGRTIASFLGLKLERDGGDQFLVAGKETKPFYGKVIIDESSCIDSRLMNEFILPLLPNAIFVGDEAQLPPVNEDKSPFMEVEGPHYTLDKVYRFGDEILDVAHQFRHAILNSDLNSDIHIPDEWLSDGRAPDEVAIAWRNVTVRHWQEDRPWYAGQQVRVGQFYCGLPTEMDAVITKVGRVVTREGVTCQSILLDGEHDVLVAVDQSEVDRQLKSLAAARDWRPFWNLKDTFCDLRQGCSITAHKAQGSTYPKVFVDFSDIFLNKRKLEALKCAYVGLTRAQHSVRCLI